jgi:hypothetical protein
MPPKQMPSISSFRRVRYANRSAVNYASVLQSHVVNSPARDLHALLFQVDIHEPKQLVTQIALLPEPEFVQRTPILGSRVRSPG